MYHTIVRGTKGNFAAFEAMLKDLCRAQLAVKPLYLLGNIVGPRRAAVQMVSRIQTPVRCSRARGWSDLLYLGSNELRLRTVKYNAAKGFGAA